MKTKSLLALLMTSLLVSACGMLDGTLALESPLTLRDMKGKTLQLQPGHYPMKLAIRKEGRKIVLKLRDNDADRKGRHRKLGKIRIEAEPAVSEYGNNSYLLRGRDIGQDFDLKITVGNDSQHDSWDGLTGCESGICEIHHSESHYQREVHLTFLNPDTGREIGSFTGTASWSVEMTVIEGNDSPNCSGFGSDNSFGSSFGPGFGC